jgi:hypothetical protein
VEQKVTETDVDRLGNIGVGAGGHDLILCNVFLEMDFVKVGIKLWFLQMGP